MVIERVVESAYLVNWLVQMIPTEDVANGGTEIGACSVLAAIMMGTYHLRPRNATATTTQHRIIIETGHGVVVHGKGPNGCILLMVRAGISTDHTTVLHRNNIQQRTRLRRRR